MNIKTVALIRSSNLPELQKTNKSIEDTLKARGIKVVEVYKPYNHVDPKLPDEDIDLAMVLGGDGTALRGARICAARNIPILPINFGHFGFINEIVMSEWEEELDLLLEDRADIDQYHLIEVSIGGRSWIALNDVTVYSTEYGTIYASMYRKGELITKYRADGIIISTPTGSTAHSLSTGGPIIAPGINAFMINPIAPFTLSNRPLILPIKDVLTLIIEKQQRRNALLVVDGQVCLGLLTGSAVKIADAQLRASIIHSSKRNYFEILREKLGWAGDFRA